MTLSGRLGGAAVTGKVVLPVRVDEQLVNLLTQFLLDEPAAAGGGLEFSGKAQAPGAP
jgi:hypothetical protein